MKNSQKISKSAVEEQIDSLLLGINRKIEVEEVWRLMDEVWDDLGCNNLKVDPVKLSTYYNHSVWLLNGLFIEQHDISLQHRQIIADWINRDRSQIRTAIDFGGGFGTLARLIAEKNKNIVVDIYEPHPHELAMKRINKYANVRFISAPINKYDCLVSTDVLEHVPDPLNLLYQMVDKVNTGGYLIVANCFFPVIKCHLPRTFHLRFTFNHFAKLMGLDFIGRLGDGHTIIYKKNRDVLVQWKQVRSWEKISKAAFPFLKIVHFFYKRLKQI